MFRLDPTQRRKARLRHKAKVAARLMAGDVPDMTQNVAGTVALRVGAVHSLILALVFAEAHANHADLREQVSQEATAIEHIAWNLENWDGPDSRAPRDELEAYVTGVIDREWDPSAKLVGSRETTQALAALDRSILDLKPAHPRQEVLKSRMLQDISAVLDHRKTRLSLTHRSVPGVFWWVALVGYAVTVVLFFVFPATPLHIAMLSAYGAYMGLVLYFVLALSHPFLGPAAIDESPYVEILQFGLRAP